jgi:hypothetical protein
MAFIGWTYVSCSQTPTSPRADGSCFYAVGNSIAPGTYELRLLVDDGFTALAVSNSFTVTSMAQASAR